MSEVNRLLARVKVAQRVATAWEHSDDAERQHIIMALYQLTSAVYEVAHQLAITNEGLPSTDSKPSPTKTEEPK